VATALQVAAGIGLAFGAHLAVGGALFGGSLFALAWSPDDFGAAFGGLWTVWAMGLSVVQVAYLGPVALAAWRVRRPLAQGVLLGALLTVLLQTTCYGVLFAVRPRLAG
ncbi:MAG: hypothetical protein ABMB14_33085, partial [Myxococcota bacterium]